MLTSRVLSGLLIMAVSAASLAYEDDDNAFVGFKRNGVDTECTVPRLGDFPTYGDTMIGSDGGAKLTEDEADRLYKCIRRDLGRAYARSGHSAAQEYLNWQRFSTKPYRSKGHEYRYLNNYANDVAAEAYGTYGKVLPMPVGSILAKDSFVANKGGRIVLGALTVMEKKYQGFNPVTNDWQFTMILPDGRIMGTTRGEDEIAVKFCVECHTKSKNDFMMFLPKKYRVKTTSESTEDENSDSGYGYSY